MEGNGTTKVCVNGVDTEVRRGASVAEILRESGYGVTSVAVAVNHDFVPRSEYEAVQVDSGDEIEILAPMQGG